MAEKKKRKMVKVNFTGKELLENKVFDTTVEEMAKDAGIFEQGRKYGPLSIIVGEKELMSKVEDAIEGMKEGEKKIVKLLSSESFGERVADLVRVVPLKNFHDQKINPFPGLVVRVANAIGKVQSVNSGRVRIDFNHPLAGREVEYHVELVKELKNKDEVAQALYEKYYSRIPGAKKDYTNGKLTITVSGDFLKNLGKINESILSIAKDFDLEIEFKEDKSINKEGQVSIPQEIKEAKEEHVHGPNCNHEHNHVHGSSADHAHVHGSNDAHEHVHGSEYVHEHKLEHHLDLKEKIIQKSKVIDGDAVSAQMNKPKSIHSIADELKGVKKTGGFDVTRDSATTIQRPKKK